MPAGYVIYDGPSMLDGKRIIVVACALERSRNAKTGHMVQTYVLRADMHPVAAVKAGADFSICGGCKHRGNGDGTERSCYVTLAHGPSHVWRSWLRGAYEARNPSEVGELLAGKMIRLGTYGDPAAAPFEVWQELVRHASGFTGYTHQYRVIERRWADIVMASADTLDEAREARALGYRTFRVGAGTVEGIEVRCPASAEMGKKTVCADCRACMGLSGKARASIVIAPHGTGAKYARLRELEAA